ncbi:MAG: GNAT family N-acetyltransferase [Eubacterium sp.]|jgi:RimJ/RimL family protein N-acetyltransferase|nr:GNAT family N-acetyltransferase [Eubacterium sp.]
MSYYKKMTGKKVFLSPVSANDKTVESYTKWLNDRAVTDNLATSHYQNSSFSEKKWIESELENGGCQYSIVTLEDNRLVGHVGLEELCHINRVATVGIFIGESEDRGKGYGGEALKLMLEYCFGVLNLNNVMLKVLPFNKTAKALYEKLGFREFGRRRGAYYLNNLYHDIIHMDITREEWYKNGSD